MPNLADPDLPLPAALTFTPADCSSLEVASAREWLLTDGLGGFAMGTVGGLRTRRYHGLLVAATQPPIGRMMGLASLDASLILDRGRVSLATHEWSGGSVSPKGHEHLVSFAVIGGVPRWRWQVEDVVIEREVAMAYGSNAVGIVHRVLAAPGPVTLELEALATWRDVHGERHASSDPDVMRRADGCTFEDHFHLRADGWHPGGEWYLGAYHREEAARGLAATEDLWLCGSARVTLDSGSAHETVAWSGAYGGGSPHGAIELVNAARARYASLTDQAGVDEVGGALAHAADQFIVQGSGGPTVVAGYPWFGDWSRDTMTSYVGLFLDTGRTAEGRELLVAAAGSLSEGMLANTADVGGTEYNTVDAALWFLHAVDRHRTRVAGVGDGHSSGRGDLGIELLESLLSVIEHYRDGTRFGIRMDETDGLITQGADGWALTWMDARLGTYAVTPRVGKPVEINALWINGIAAVVEIMTANIAQGVHGADPRVAGLRALHAKATGSFIARFPRPDGLGLFDVVDGPDGDDASIRPNQLLAVSLPHGPLRSSGVGNVARSVVLACGPLLTPLGLRSLHPDDQRYEGRHRGDTWARDHAYHQGTVWPWLIGPYLDACAVVGSPTEHLLDPLLGHLRDWGVASVSETADGDAPHAGTGCPFQAWSVAELIRSRSLGRD